MYNVPVKIESIERRKRLTAPLHIIASLFLIINAGILIKHLNYQQLLLLYPIYAVALVSIIYAISLKKWNKRATYNLWMRIAQFICFAWLGFIFIPFANTISIITLFLWAIITLLLIFTERRIYHKTDLQLTKEGILIPGQRTHKSLPWQQVQDFIIRPDFITIIRTNQLYVQLEILKKIDADQLHNMNHFSAEQIKNHNQILNKV
jgi:cation transport ATPase